MSSSVPAVVAPPPGNPRFPLLDSLRAIAALGVLVGHAGYVAGAIQIPWYGPAIGNLDASVTLLFVLSAFLLYRPYRAALADGKPPPALVDYARRRAVRIFPAYWVALIVIALYPGLEGLDWHHFALVQNYFPGDAARGLAAAWSISIELSFYVVLPILVWGVTRFCRGPGGLARELLALAALGIASAVVRAFDLASSGTVLQLTIVETFLWFATGMVLATASVEWQRRGAPRWIRWLERRPGLVYWAAGLVYLALGIGLNTPTGQLRYSGAQWMFQHVGSLVLVVLLCFPAMFGDHRGGLPRRFLAWKPLAALAPVSYGLFLYQGGVILALAEAGVGQNIGGWAFPLLTSLDFAISLVLAIASYRLIERPMMRFKTRRRKRPAPASPPAPVRRHPVG